MSERQWERLGSASGIGFVAALLVSVFMAPIPPHIDAPSAEILDYVTGNRMALLSSAVVGAVAGLLFLMFLGHLRHVLGRSENGAEALSPVVYGAGLTTAAAAYVCSLPLVVLAFAGDSAEVASSPGLVRVLWGLNALGMATIMILLALFVAALSVAMILRELGSPMVGWIGLPIAAVNAVAGAAGFYNSNYQSFWNGLNIVGLVAFAAFVLTVSAETLMARTGAGDTRATPTLGRPLPST